MVPLTVSDRQKRREPAEMFILHKQDRYLFLRFPKLSLNFSSSNIEEVTELVHLTVLDRQNGVNPPKTAKLFKINIQDACVLSEISETVFKIFLAQILRKSQIH